MPIRITGSSIENMVEDTLNKLEFVAQDLADFILAQADKNLREADWGQAPLPSRAQGAGAFDRGGLARSGRVDSISKLHKKVIYDMEYAAAIEFGTNPHFPPINALEEWVWRKKSIFNITSRKQANSIAWSIAKTISENGTLPRPFFRKAISSLTTDKLRRIIAKHIPQS
jgi:hypothetical protein